MHLTCNIRALAAKKAESGHVIPSDRPSSSADKCSRVRCAQMSLQKTCVKNALEQLQLGGRIDSTRSASLRRRCSLVAAAQVLLGGLGQRGLLLVQRNCNLETMLRGY